MDTVRVDICYRPLRVAWAVHSEDWESFRHAIRLSHTLFGGRFNPIILVDRPDATAIVDLFRADMVIPLGDDKEVVRFGGSFPHLRSPLFREKLFINDNPSKATVLDIHNALVYWRETPAWKALLDQGLRTFSWSADDPLADIFLIQYGEYPPLDAIGIDYYERLNEAALPMPVVDCRINKDAPVPVDTLDHPSLVSIGFQN